MSELYNRYVAGKKPAEIAHNVVTDICRRRISGDSLKSLIAELDKNGILDDTVIKTPPKSEWNEEYLELLSYEAVGGTFSKQYLLHLAEVAAYVQINSKASRHKTTSISTVIFGLVVLGMVIIGMILANTMLKG